MLDEEWNNLRGYAATFGLDFIVDIFGVKSLKTAEKIGLQTVKVHGTDITNILFTQE